MTSNPTVRTVLLNRAKTKSKRGNRADNFHLSMVIECGGMRGVVAAGFVQTFAQNGLLDCFDTVHGSSSGACAAAYFLAEQSEEGRRIYLEDICSRTVVNPFGWFTQPCMVDTDYIVDEVFAKKRRLNVEKIISEPTVLNIVTTSVADGVAIVHKNFRTADQVLLALKATLRVPGLFEPGILIQERRHLDGGIAAPVPIFSAVEAGATHILVICTQREQDYAAFDKGGVLEGMFLGIRYGPRLRASYMRNHNLRSHVDVPSSVRIEQLIRPAQGTRCRWYTTEKSTLEKVEQEAINVAKAYLLQGQ